MLYLLPSTKTSSFTLRSFLIYYYYFLSRFSFGKTQYFIATCVLIQFFSHCGKCRKSYFYLEYVFTSGACNWVFIFVDIFFWYRSQVVNCVVATVYFVNTLKSIGIYTWPKILYCVLYVCLKPFLLRNYIQSAHCKKGKFDHKVHILLGIYIFLYLYKGKISYSLIAKSIFLL